MKTKDMACLLLYVLLLVSCTRAVSDSIPIGERELPDMVMKNASYTMARGSDEPVVMQASLITVYKGNRDTELEKVTFRRGEDLSGYADFAKVDPEGSRAELSGNVRLEKTGEETMTIQAQNLVWNNGDNSVLCEGEVFVTYGDGTSIRAVGFSGLPDENRYEFSTILEGNLEE